METAVDEIAAKALDDLFPATPHRETEEIRASAKALAAAILRHTVWSDSQAKVIDQLRELVVGANALVVSGNS